MNKNKRMSTLGVGERGIVAELVCGNDMRRRFLDLGLTAGCEVECVGKSPLGDPRAYLLRGKTVAIRRTDADNVVLI